jgi:hypothetical protein
MTVDVGSRREIIRMYLPCFSAKVVPLSRTTMTMKPEVCSRPRIVKRERVTKSEKNLLPAGPHMGREASNKCCTRQQF